MPSQNTPERQSIVSIYLKIIRCVNVHISDNHSTCVYVCEIQAHEYGNNDNVLNQ